MPMRPEIEDINLCFTEIEDRLVVQLIDCQRNKERLKEVIYKPVGNDLALLAYVILREDKDGSLAFAVTKDVASSNNYDVDALFDVAIANTQEERGACLQNIEDLMFGKVSGASNFLKGEHDSSEFSEMLVLTNYRKNFGAVVLFYPGMQEKVGKVVGGNYYVLPSSIHEVLILPEGRGIDEKELHRMVKDANRTIVEPQDVLSDRVFKYDSEMQKIFELKEPERYVGGRQTGNMRVMEER